MPTYVDLRLYKRRRHLKPLSDNKFYAGLAVLATISGVCLHLSYKFFIG